MTPATHFLEAAERGDTRAAQELLPLVYDELRHIAARQLAEEKPGQTLEATGLVHEAYLRLIGSADGPRWQGRSHFVAAAAEAMRRILIENARSKNRQKRGGQWQRTSFNEQVAAINYPPEELLAVDEALAKLSCDDPVGADVVKLCYYAGLSVDEAAVALKLARTTAYRHWSYARAWIWCELRERSI